MLSEWRCVATKVNVFKDNEFTWKNEFIVCCATGNSINIEGNSFARMIILAGGGKGFGGGGDNCATGSAVRIEFMYFAFDGVDITRNKASVGYGILDSGSTSSSCSFRETSRPLIAVVPITGVRTETVSEPSEAECSASVVPPESLSVI